MADLKTHIGGDDAEFQRTMSRVDSRITSLHTSVRGVSKGIVGLFKLGGAVAAVNVMSAMTRQLVEMQIAADNAGDSIRKIGQGVVDSLRPKDATLPPVEQEIAELRERVKDQRKAIEDEANKQSTEIRVRDINPFQKAAWWAVTGKTTDEQVADIQGAKERELKRISDFAQRKEQELRKNARDKERSDFIDAQIESERTYKEFHKRWQGAQQSFGNTLVDSQISVLEGAGLGNAADTARLRERTRRQLIEIDENDMLSDSQKRNSRDFYEKAYKAEKMLLDERSVDHWRGMAKSFQGNAGGATFAQQMADIQRPLNTVNEEIRDAALAILSEMQVISARENVTSYN